MTMQLLSSEATKEFNEAMNPVIKTDMFTSVSLSVTPDGVLQTPLRVFDNGFITDQSGNEKIQQTVARGYKNVSLTYTGRVYKNTGIHRLVLFGFKQEWSSREDKTTVHHINTVTNDNHISNLKLISNSDNVLRFFRGADNQSEIANQEYLDERIAQQVVPMVHKGEVVKGYSIDAFGHVYHENKQGKLVEVSLSVANPKYPTNKNVKFNGTSASIHGLMAENFLKVPSGKYKALLIDKTLDNPYIATNIYTVAKKHQ